MSQNPNPFLRGYWNLKIVRTLSISHEDGSPHVWRNIHPSQHHLSDEALVSSPCIVTGGFAPNLESNRAALDLILEAIKGAVTNGL